MITRLKTYLNPKERERERERENSYKIKEFVYIILLEEKRVEGFTKKRNRKLEVSVSGNKNNGCTVTKPHSFLHPSSLLLSTFIQFKIAWLGN